GESDMQAVIIRHGKVNFKWKTWSTSEQFNEDCKMYDKAPIFPVCSDVSQMNYQNIYVSSLARSRETAKQLFGEKGFISTKLIDEVPLCACVTSNRKLPLVFWNVLGRLQWLLNIHFQKECRNETVQRAELFVKMIVEKNEDCIIVSHGFFMHTLINVMKKWGFQISHTRIKYSNGEYILAQRFHRRIQK
ncbi:MAG: hypothetical protein ACI39N_03980, partial [Lachnospiraceae bacterium]